MHFCTTAVVPWKLCTAPQGPYTDKGSGASRVEVVEDEDVCSKGYALFFRSSILLHISLFHTRALTLSTPSSMNFSSGTEARSALRSMRRCTDMPKRSATVAIFSTDYSSKSCIRRHPRACMRLRIQTLCDNWTFGGRSTRTHVTKQTQTFSSSF